MITPSKKRQMRRANAPPSQAILMATWTRWSTTPGITWYSITLSHWTLPSGDYLLRIAPAATRVTINKMTMQNAPTQVAVLMAIAMRRYYIACITRWRKFVAFIKATKCHHRASTRSDSINWTHQRRLFWLFHREKGLELTCWPLITIGVWHIKLMRST